MESLTGACFVPFDGTVAIPPKSDLSDDDVLRQVLRNQKDMQQRQDEEAARFNQQLSAQKTEFRQQLSEQEAKSFEQAANLCAKIEDLEEMYEQKLSESDAKIVVLEHKLEEQDEILRYGRPQDRRKIEEQENELQRREHRIEQLERTSRHAEERQLRWSRKDKICDQLKSDWKDEKKKHWVFFRAEEFADESQKEIMQNEEIDEDHREKCLEENATRLAEAQSKRDVIMGVIAATSGVVFGAGACTAVTLAKAGVISVALVAAGPGGAAIATGIAVALVGCGLIYGGYFLWKYLKNRKEKSE